MKNFYIYSLLFINSIIFSQKIITDPEFPIENGSIEITFNINEMSNKSLLGYAGTLYTHTGVNTNLADWQHVIGNWGENSVQPTLARVGTDLYRLTIANIRQFYSVTNNSEVITSLNFVLRSSDASLQSEDLFIPVFEEGLNIKFIEPEAFPIYPEEGEEINIVVLTNGADSLTFLLNDEIRTVTYTDTLSTTVIADGTGRQNLKFIAKRDESVYEYNTHFYIREPITIEDLPNNTKPGINYIDANTVILAVFAPNKDFVYTIGDFNNWEFDPDNSTTWEFNPNYYCKLTPDSTIFWTTITNLNPNEEYRFQYFVDGEIRIADPYADKILEPQYNDQIPNSTYPNLIQYPYGKTSEIVSVLETNQTPYNWINKDFERPAKTDLVIYELLIRDFIKEHDFKTLKDSLHYFHNLGVNAIELMPVIEFGGNLNWGYEPIFQFAVDKYYGTKNDLKEFIDECHSLGIAVIFDVVLNHVYGQSPLVRLYNEENYGNPTSDNPWLNTEPTHPFNVGFDFNHESLYTKQLVDRFNKYWLEEYNIDGFRFDLTKGMTQTYSGNDVALMARYDQSRIDILTRMGDKIKSYDPTAILILEHYSENSEETVLANYGFMIWGKLTDEYNEATMGYHDNDKSDFSDGSYKKRGWNEPHLVTLMENHDEERLMYKNLKYGNTSGSYSVKDTATALNRMKLAAAFFYTIPGPKLIWKFGELGYDYSKFYDIKTKTVVPDNDHIKLAEKPIRWDYLEDPNRLNLFKVNKALINIKKNYEVFRTKDFSLNLSNSIKSIKLNHWSMNVVIVGNFGILTDEVTVDFQNDGIWYNYFSGDSIIVQNFQNSFTFAPGEFVILTNKKLPTPEADILLNIEEIDITPSEFSLSQNYPNPFNPSTTISYSIPSNIDYGGNVKLIVYDVLGRQVNTLVNQKAIPGEYSVIFEGSDLTSGIYFYTISVGEYYQTKKMILLK